MKRASPGHEVLLEVPIERRSIFPTAIRARIRFAPGG